MTAKAPLSEDPRTDMEHAGEGLRRAAWLAALFVLAFVVRSLYAVDQAPDMYTPEQEGTRMAQRYDDAALSILSDVSRFWTACAAKKLWPSAL